MLPLSHSGAPKHSRTNRLIYVNSLIYSTFNALHPSILNIIAEATTPISNRALTYRFHYQIVLTIVLFLKTYFLFLFIHLFHFVIIIIIGFYQSSTIESLGDDCVLVLSVFDVSEQVKRKLI